MDPQTLQKLLIAIPAILIAITYHEIAHGWVADKLGDPTARMLGRLSPNPIRHIDPFGTILLPILLFVMTQGQMVLGYAKPVPVNPRNLGKLRRDMAMVAAAGPATNLAMAAASTILLRLLAPVAHPEGVNGILRLLMRAGESFQPANFLALVLYPVCLVLAYLVFINVLLALFNLIPIPPLDGGRILSSFLPPEWSMRLDAAERYGFLIILAILWLDPLGVWSRGFYRLFHAVLTLFFL